MHPWTNPGQASLDVRITLDSRGRRQPGTDFTENTHPVPIRVPAPARHDLTNGISYSPIAGACGKV